MLGVPASPGFLGWGLLGVGALGAAFAVLTLRRRFRGVDRVAAAGAFCLVVTVAALPYVAWRFVEDLQVTTKLHGYDRASAGPVQAYLPGYLADGAKHFVAPGATFATAVGPEIPWPAARAAFPSLAFETLFPRVSVSDSQKADYLVTWGIAPGRIAPVSRVWVARPKVGDYAAVYVGKVRH